MLITSLILPLISLLSLTSSIEGYEWYSESCSCYKLHKEEVTWLAAYQTCVQEDARLAVANSGQEEGLLSRIYHEYMSETLLFIPLKDRMAVGIYWDAWTEDWMTADGEIYAQDRFTYHWTKTPTTVEKMPYAFSHLGGLINGNHNMKGVFICEKNLTSPDLFIAL